MIVSFKDEGTRDIFEGNDTARARRACPAEIWTAARKKLDALNRAERVDELRDPPGNRLEHLKGHRRGTYSIRINDQYRVCFRWHGAWPEDVEIVDYH